MPVADYDDDLTIGSSETLYRRIARSNDTNMLIFDEGLDAYRVRSGAFSMDADGCSAYLGSELSRAGIGAADVAKTPQNVVVSVSVRGVRSAGLGIRRDPWPGIDDPHPRDVAHALMVNSSRFGRRPLGRALSSLARTAVICISGEAE